MDHPRPWMKFVDVKDLDAEAKFGDMDVLSSDGEKLGRLDGFIIDETSARPYHVVVSAGHWFTHKHFLVPIGHVTTNGSTLIADLPFERAKGFPGFDRKEFERMSADDLTKLNDSLASPWSSGNHYQSPDWWKDNYYRSTVGDRH
jgi:hypothetical protein